jgi:transposase
MSNDEVEHAAADMTPEARRACRQQHAAPLLAEINAVRDAIAATALPKPPLGDAVRYRTNQWDALQRYVDDGGLAIGCSSNAYPSPQHRPRQGRL